jgi:ribose 5-phosphate isomerase B
MKIAIASDHAGFELKEIVKNHLQHNGAYEIIDLGAMSEESVDYPDFGFKLAKHVSRGTSDFGILICGSGIGISIAANRNPAIRCALCHNEETAKLARKHNDANVIALGARIIDEGTALKAIDTFLNTEFEGGRHADRVKKLSC